MAILTITQKQNNTQTAAAALSEVTHLNGMKADGTPVRLSMPDLIIDKANLSDTVVEQIQSVYNSIPTINGNVAQNTDDIEDLDSRVESLESHSVWLTEDEYEALEAANEVDPDTEYNVY